MNRTSKLSRSQKSVLIWLCRRYSESQASSPERAGLPTDGIHLRPVKREDRKETLRERASISRSIRLLEKRGLVEREHRGGKLFLKLTESGRKLAQPLYDEAKAALDIQRQAES